MFGIILPLFDSDSMNTDRKQSGLQRVNRTPESTVFLLRTDVSAVSPHSTQVFLQA